MRPDKSYCLRIVIPARETRSRAGCAHRIAVSKIETAPDTVRWDSRMQYSAAASIHTGDDAVRRTY